MEPLNPVQIEFELRDANTRLENGTKTVRDALEEYLDAKSAYEVAYAHAYLDAEGSIKDKEVQAVIATESQRNARDVAEVAYKYAKDLMRSLEQKQSTLQTISAGIRQAYAGSGHGS